MPSTNPDKAKTNERARRWREKNPDRVRQIQKAWREQNPDHQRKYLSDPGKRANKNRKRSEWRKANRDKENEYARRYRSDPEKYAKMLERQRESHQRRREDILARQRARYAKDAEYREARRFQHIRGRYGLSRDEYTALFNEQKGKCVICREAETSKTRTRLSVDHCHTTGRVRGLLCVNCNSAIGLLKEDRKRAKKLLEYLQHHARLSRRKTPAGVRK